MVDGTLIFDTKIDSSGVKNGAQKLNKELNKSASGAGKLNKELKNTSQSANKVHTKVKPIDNEIDKAAKSARNLDTNLSGIIGGSLKKIGGMMLTAFSVRQVVNFGKEAVGLASDLQEVQNVVDIAFEDMGYKCEEFAKKSIESFGMSELSAKKMSSNFMLMGKNSGLGKEQAADMALNLTARVGDLSSVRNEDLSELQTKLQAVFTGETEGLKLLGISMTESTLKSYALANGIEKSYSEMSTAEKTALRYSYVMEQTAYAEGDYLKTSDSWANSTKRVKESFDEVKASLGEAFITVLTPAVSSLDSFINKLKVAAEVFKALAQDIFGKKIEEQEVEKPLKEPIEELTETQEEYTDSVEESTKAQERQLASFDKLNRLVDNNKKDSVMDSSELNKILDTASEQNLKVNIDSSDIDKTNKALGETQSRIEAIKNSKTYKNLLNFFTNIKNEFKDLWNNHLSRFFESFSRFGVEFGKFCERSAFVKGILDGIKTFLEGILDVLSWIISILTLPFAMFNAATADPEDQGESLKIIEDILKDAVGEGLYEVLLKFFKNIKIDGAYDVYRPKLATGTVVPANYGEFTAILGDNKREPEIVSPLSTMKQAVAEVLSEMGLTVSIDNHLYLDSDEVTNVFIKNHNQTVKRTGKTPLKGVKTI